MNFNSCKTWASAIAIAFLTVPAYALSLSDPGVVGAASGETADNANVATATTIAQHLLDMPANDADPDGCLVTGDVACYQTSATNYDANLTGGTRIDGSTPGSPDIHDISGYEYVLAKYDGPGGGYILINVADFGDTLPDTSEPLWLNNPGNAGLGLSGFTGWGATSTPDSGATVLLLGAALTGLGFARRFMHS